jgi:hypothetical protein
VILVFQFWGNLQSALYYPPGFTSQFDATTIIEHRDDQALIQFLNSIGLSSGYSQYWVAYPLAFRSGETLIFPPRLPYHQDLRYTSRDNRYAPYNVIADGNPQPAYITANTPALDERIMNEFESRGIHWAEDWVGGYHIFYNLSRPLRPEEMNLSPSLP